MSAKEGLRFGEDLLKSRHRGEAALVYPHSVALRFRNWHGRNSLQVWKGPGLVVRVLGKRVLERWLRSRFARSLCRSSVCIGSQFWLDNYLYPDVRRTTVRRPLFIVGVPRSGTTALHRLIAENDDRFTSLRLWEVLLAPALCQKKLVRCMARLGSQGRTTTRA